MEAMVLEKLQTVHGESSPLHLREVPIPRPGEGEVRLRVLACGVCHTELDAVIDTTPVWRPIEASLPRCS